MINFWTIVRFLGLVMTVIICLGVVYIIADGLMSPRKGK